MGSRSQSVGAENKSFLWEMPREASPEVKSRMVIPM